MHGWALRGCSSGDIVHVGASLDACCEDNECGIPSTSSIVFTNVGQFPKMVSHASATVHIFHLTNGHSIAT
jgi:hypothetical protein